MIISIFASIGCHNLGDELILKNEIKMLEDKYGKDVEFKVFTYDINDNFCKKSNIEYIEYFPIFSRNFRFILRNMKNFINFIRVVSKSDLVVVGGGGLFFDNEFQSTADPLKQWLFRTNLFELMNKKVIFLGVGLNIKDKANYHRIKKIFSFASKVTVRDEYSKNLLKELGVKSKLISDPVYLDNKKTVTSGSMIMSMNASEFKLKELKTLDYSGKTIGICFRVGYIKDEEKNTRELIDYIVKSKGKVILIPHSFHQIDTLANDFVFLESFTSKNVSIVQNMKEAYDVYKNKKIDLCISMRYHSMVLARIYGIDFVAISYTKKTEELIKELS